MKLHKGVPTLKYSSPPTLLKTNKTLVQTGARIGLIMIVITRSQVEWESSTHWAKLSSLIRLEFLACKESGFAFRFGNSINYFQLDPNIYSKDSQKLWLRLWTWKRPALESQVESVVVCARPILTMV